MLRQALVLLPLLLAGCASPEDSVEPEAKPGTPWRSEGAFFVKPSGGSGLAVTEVPFLVNATGFTATATLAVGSRQGPVELPRSTAYVEARLVDADGKVHAEARRMPAGEPTLKLEAKDFPAGEATLVIAVGGGSDGEANGDHVTFALDAR